MRSFAVALFIPALALSQGFDNPFLQAPPHIDKALRERIAVFYNAHKDGKFRVADSVVHEDSKEVFFGAEKNRFREWKLVTINYDQDFTKAKVVIDVDTDFVFPGFGKMAVHRPMSSTWKVDSSGAWWWYVVVTECSESPFGPLCKGPDTPGGGGSLNNLFDLQGVKPEQLQSKLVLDRKEVTLSSHEQSLELVSIKNTWEFPINISCGNTDLPGLGVVLEKSTIEPGETVKLRISFKPVVKVWRPDVQAWVKGEQISAGIPITIHFAQPPNNQPAPGTKVPVPVIPPAKP